MSKITKNQLLRRIEALEKFAKYADDMLTELNHALPDPEYDAKCEENAVAAEESLARHDVRLGLVKPKLKQLDQSVFDGAPNDKRFFAIDEDGQGWFYRDKPSINEDDKRWTETNYTSTRAGFDYDASNWRNSLIERETLAAELLEVDLSSELTGSDLCRYLKGRKHWVLAVVSDENDATAEFHQRATVVTGVTNDGRFKCGDTIWRYAVPINNQGEPLTASEVGL